MNKATESSRSNSVVAVLVWQDVLDLAERTVPQVTVRTLRAVVAHRVLHSVADYIASNPAITRISLAPKDLNVLPFLLMAFNCASWIGYGCATEDAYQLVGNVVGMLLGFFYLVSTYHLTNSEVRVVE